MSFVFQRSFRGNNKRYKFLSLGKPRKIWFKRTDGYEGKSGRNGEWSCFLDGRHGQGERHFVSSTNLTVVTKEKDKLLSRTVGAGGRGGGEGGVILIISILPNIMSVYMRC